MTSNAIPEAEQALQRAREAVRAGLASEAREAAVAAFRADPSALVERRAAMVLAAVKDAPWGGAPSAEARIALLGNVTLDVLAPGITLRAAADGLRPSVYLGPFGAHWTEVLDGGSGLRSFAPGISFFFIDPRPVLGEAWSLPAAAGDAAQAVRPYLDELARLVEAARARLPGRIVVANAVAPARSPLAGPGGAALAAAIDAGLRRIAGAAPGVHVLDLDRAASAFGLERAVDPRMELIGRVPFSDAFLPRVCEELARFVRAALGRQSKCLVLDLDNTLWGGVVGETGPHGIAVGDDHPGNAFKAFQQGIKRLAARGVILAIASKNNREDALAALDGNANMVLRSADFACLKIDWKDKAGNVAAIARELNIGLDQLVFLDDNPAERLCVRAAFPQVLVPELPADPAQYARFLEDLAARRFDLLEYSREDLERGRLYAEEARRKELLERFTGGAGGEGGSGAEDGAASLEGYYRSLEQRVALEDLGEATIDRFVQLLGKTNQFNLSTRRHSAADLMAWLATGRWRAWTLRVADRFGDAGLVGCALAEEQEPGRWRLDSFLMSCRVIGRTVETAFLGLVLEQLREAGGRELAAEFIPTAKNKPAAGFLAAHGFRLQSEEPGGRKTYSTDPRENPTVVPDWFRVDGKVSVP